MNRVPFLPIIDLAAFAAMPVQARSNATEQTAGSPSAVCNRSRSKHVPGTTNLLPIHKYSHSSYGSYAIWHNLTQSVSYSDTDILAAEAAYLLPSFSVGQEGSGAIINDTITVPLTSAL